MQIAKLFILFGHLIVVLFASVRLDRAGLSRNRSMFFSFVLVGLLFGLIAMAIGSSSARALVNPLGTWIGDWLYNNWDPALNNPDLGREPSIPWLLHIPQVYVLVTTLMYAAIGSLTWLSGVFGVFDPHSYIGRVPDLSEEEDDEAKDEQSPQVESEVEETR